MSDLLTFRLEINCRCDVQPEVSLEGEQGRGVADQFEAVGTEELRAEQVHVVFQLEAVDDEVDVRSGQADGQQGGDAEVAVPGVLRGQHDDRLGPKGLCQPHQGLAGRDVDALSARDETVGELFLVPSARKLLHVVQDLPQWRLGQQGPELVPRLLRVRLALAGADKLGEPLQQPRVLSPRRQPLERP